MLAVDGEDHAGEIAQDAEFPESVIRDEGFDTDSEIRDRDQGFKIRD
jgi:hypothetical protein